MNVAEEFKKRANQFRDREAESRAIAEMLELSAEDSCDHSDWEWIRDEGMEFVTLKKTCKFCGKVLEVHPRFVTDEAQEIYK